MELVSLCRLPTRPSRMFNLPMETPRQRTEALAFDLTLLRAANRAEKYEMDLERMRNG